MSKAVVQWIAVALATAALGWLTTLGVTNFLERYREQGRAEVRAQWVSADNERQAKERQALIDLQAAERGKEQRMAREAEENDRVHVKREEVLRDRAAAAERAAAGLRDTVARLDADSSARRAEGTCAAAEREADEAATARGLLGACAGRYSELGKRAGELANQVMGLQDHIVVVQPEAVMLIEEEK
jgi:hypothetical protein